jgi:hypothetical protein
MAALVSKLDMTDQVVGGIRVKLTMKRTFALRLKAAALLIRLASHISPLNVDVVVQDKP